MELLISKLNRFTYPKKYYFAWNALMAAYAFEHLNFDQQQLVMNNVAEVESSNLGQPIEFNQIAVNLSRSQLYYLYSLAFIRLGIPPALGSESWYKIPKTNNIVNINKKILTTTKRKLEKQFKVVFPLI